MTTAVETEDVELARVKSEIRSLLISRPQKSMLLDSFLLDYKNTIGKDLPFRRYNFRSPIGFLSTIPDTVEIKEINGKCQLVAVITESSSHIKNLVDGQRNRIFKPRSNFRPPRALYRFVGTNHYQTWHHPPSHPVFPVRAVQYGKCHSSWIQFSSPYVMPFTQTDFTSYRNRASIRATVPPLRYNGHPVNDKHLAKVTTTQSSGVEVGSKKASQIENYDETDNVASKSGNQVLDGMTNNKADQSDTDTSTHAAVSSNISNYSGRSVNVDEMDKYEFDEDIRSLKMSCPKTTTAETSSLPRHYQAGDIFPTQTIVAEHSDIESCSTLSAPVSQSNADTSYKSKDSSSELSSILKSRISSILETFPHGISTSKFLEEYQMAHSEALDIASLGYSSLKEMVWKNNDVFVFEKSKIQADWLLHDARIKPKRRQRAGQHCIPHQVMDNLAKLAQCNPDGIDSSEILEMYKEKFGISVRPEKLGFHNVLNFLKHCDSITLKIYGDLGIVYPKFWTNARVDEEPWSSSPTFKMRHHWAPHFKEFECDLTSEFKPPVIPKEGVVSVKMVDIVSPSCIWLRFLDDTETNQMLKKLSEHYKKEEANYVLPRMFALQGLPVAAFLSGSWHRAIIDSVNGPIARIKYVDFGTTSLEKIENLRKLDRRFAKLPISAVSASLFSLVPSEGEQWSQECCEFLQTNWHDVSVSAAVCAVDSQEPHVDVILFDDSELLLTNLNNALVSRGYARYLMKTVPLINRFSVAKFGQLLPRWFSSSTASYFDEETCLKNLLSVMSDEINSTDDHETTSCCKAHCFQEFFKQNPTAMVDVWKEAIKLEEEKIMKNAAMLLKSYAGFEGTKRVEELRDFCASETGSNVKNSPVEFDWPTEDVGAKGGQTPVASVEAALDIPNGPSQDQLGSTCLDETVKIRNSDPNTLFSRKLPEHETPYVPIVVKYAKIRALHRNLTVIQFEGKNGICLSQIIELIWWVPKAHVMMRFTEVQSNISFIDVSPNVLPALFRDLYELNLIRWNEPSILVQIDDARHLIQAIDPVYDTQPLFSAVAQIKHDCWIKPVSP